MEHRYRHEYVTKCNDEWVEQEEILSLDYKTLRAAFLATQPHDDWYCIDDDPIASTLLEIVENEARMLNSSVEYLYKQDVSDFLSYTSKGGKVEHPIAQGMLRDVYNESSLDKLLLEGIELPYTMILFLLSDANFQFNEMNPCIFGGCTIYPLRGMSIAQAQQAIMSDNGRLPVDMMLFSYGEGSIAIDFRGELNVLSTIRMTRNCHQIRELDIQQISNGPDEYGFICPTPEPLKVVADANTIQSLVECINKRTDKQLMVTTLPSIKVEVAEPTTFTEDVERYAKERKSIEDGKLVNE